MLVRNVLDAKGFFTTVAPTEKQNEFGFKLGGPVYIPKIYDGKDKTFFFTNFNWFRFRGGNSNSLTTLPTAAMKTGDFSSLVNPSINLGINFGHQFNVRVRRQRRDVCHGLRGEELRRRAQRWSPDGDGR